MSVKKEEYLKNDELMRPGTRGGGRRMEEKSPKFHFSWCKTLAEKKGDGTFDRYVMLRNKSGRFIVQAREDRFSDAYKLKEIGFFDEDYFLYWEDIDLMKKVNNTKYKMVVAKNIFAKHYSSQSSEDTFKIQFLRKSNFMYGELLYDFKHREIRYIKISRKFVQNVFLFFFNLLFFDLKRSIINLASLIGILKFILYLFKKFKI